MICHTPVSQDTNGVDVSTDTDKEGITDDLDEDDDGGRCVDVDEGCVTHFIDGSQMAERAADGSHTVTEQCGPVNTIVVTILSGIGGYAW